MPRFSLAEIDEAFFETAKFPFSSCQRLGLSQDDGEKLAAADFHRMFVRQLTKIAERKEAKRDKRAER